MHMVEHLVDELAIHRELGHISVLCHYAFETGIVQTEHRNMQKLLQQQLESVVPERLQRLFVLYGVQDV